MGEALRGKVAVVLHEPHLGGATRSVLRIVPLLQRLGWRFVFWVPRPSAVFDELVSAGFDVQGAPRYIEYSLRAWRLPPGPRRRLGAVPPYLRAFREFVRRRSPALVHANSILTVAEALVARTQGVPTLLHVHEMVPRGARGHLLRRTAWRRLDEVVAVSRASAAALSYGGAVPRIVYEGAPV
ncbi:MAG: glycosyltransferase, partial [Actinomycetota bacterium]|nr:glycosyltransferase [Actinomycetota bacterium]